LPWLCPKWTVTRVLRSRANKIPLGNLLTHYEAPHQLSDKDHFSQVKGDVQMKAIKDFFSNLMMI
jgi:hypothetical protein